MSNLINKVKSHLPHHTETHNQSDPSTNLNTGLHQTYHQDNILPGPVPGTIAHKTEDHWNGPNQSISNKETVIEPTAVQLHSNSTQPVYAPRSAPLTSNVPIAAPLQPAAPIQATRTVLEPSTRTIVDKPTLVKETLLPEERIEVQPVIHRERVQKEVHKVVQPMREKDIMPTKVVQATLADQVRDTVVQSDASFQSRSREADRQYTSSTEYGALRSETYQKPAIVEEHVRKTIVEEVQPVLYRETVVPVLIQETQPIYEQIIEAPTVVTEERAFRDLGTQFVSTSLDDQRAYQEMGLPSQSFVQTTITQTIHPLESNVLHKDQFHHQNTQKNPMQPNINNTRLV